MEKHKRLVDLLLKRSEEGKLDWKPSLDGDFQVSFAYRTLLIKQIARKTNAGTNYYDFIISITDEEGRIVDSFKDADLDDEQSFEYPWYAALSKLFELARRSALGADKAVNEILAELEDEVLF